MASSSSEITDYERKRLENIRRNDELMASLKLHSLATQLSTSTKRRRDETKSSKISSQKKPKSDQTPIVIRRSLRTRGMPPDSDGLPSDLVDLPPRSARSVSASPEKVLPRKLGPISMRDAYREDGSDRALIETLKRIGKKSEVHDSPRAKTAGGRDKKEEDCEVGGTFDLNSKSNSVNVGEKLSGDWVCKGENSSDSIKKEENEVQGLSPENIGEKFSGNGVCESANMSDSVKKEEDGVEGSFDLYSMSLNPENVARILSDRIMHARFFPCSSSRILAVGNKLGDVGFWNLNHQRDDEGAEDGIFTYHSHSGPVSGISIHEHCLSKVFTSCYDGYIRLMDAEKEVFDLVYSSEYSIFSISQRSNDAKCLYFGEASGLLNIWDERTGKCSSRRVLHVDRINSIDFSSDNPNVLATSSSDGNVCIWDLRSVDANKPKALKTITHKRSVHSAYFSPSGKCLASTSFDDTVGIHSGINFEKTTMIQHYNQTGRWISPFSVFGRERNMEGRRGVEAMFVRRERKVGGGSGRSLRAVWGWDDSYVFVGNMKRGVDVISPSQRRTIFTLQSPHVSAIPCRFDAHPYNVGMLAGATGGGQVYVWTLS
ncbi:hypothetical protein TIFTF001_016343 [Ficus carica]|uniref:WD repeat-containing protein 76 n=1 Tax=Ficus carica TaxID=3494 RepID=A0AA88D634_FICCA|nr:hypothetical protein TIFTF001_016343 [Ficus carica]